MSQAAVAKAVGTSQSAIARMETARENITLSTLQRLVVALNGLFYVSIRPKENAPAPKRPWWEDLAMPVEPNWKVSGYIARRDTKTDQMIIGLERPHELEIASTSQALDASNNVPQLGATSL
jgi:transcriptional regulator with XRE-family HTH domain